MKRLPKLIELLCQHPEWTNVRIARAAYFSDRTVRRYRALLHERGWEWEELSKQNAQGLDVLFNPERYAPCKKTLVDWPRVRELLKEPRATFRDAWEDYRARVPRPHMGYRTFRKKVGGVMQRRFVERDTSPGIWGQSEKNASQ